MKLLNNIIFFLLLYLLVVVFFIKVARFEVCTSNEECRNLQVCENYQCIWNIDVDLIKKNNDYSEKIEAFMTSNIDEHTKELLQFLKDYFKYKSYLYKTNNQYVNDLNHLENDFFKSPTFFDQPKDDLIQSLKNKIRNQPSQYYHFMLSTQLALLNDDHCDSECKNKIKNWIKVNNQLSFDEMKTFIDQKTKKEKNYHIGTPSKYHQEKIKKILLYTIIFVIALTMIRISMVLISYLIEQVKHSRKLSEDQLSTTKLVDIINASEVEQIKEINNTIYVDLATISFEKTSIQAVIKNVQVENQLTELYLNYIKKIEDSFKQKKYELYDLQSVHEQLSKSPLDLKNKLENQVISLVLNHVQYISMPVLSEFFKTFIYIRHIEKIYIPFYQKTNLISKENQQIFSTLLFISYANLIIQTLKNYTFQEINIFFKHVKDILSINESTNDQINKPLLEMANVLHEHQKLMPNVYENIFSDSKKAYNLFFSWISKVEKVNTSNDDIFVFNSIYAYLTMFSKRLYLTDTSIQCLNNLFKYKSIQLYLKTEQIISFTMSMYDEREDISMSSLYQIYKDFLKKYIQLHQKQYDNWLSFAVKNRLNLIILIEKFNAIPDQNSRQEWFYLFEAFSKKDMLELGPLMVRGPKDLQYFNKVITPTIPLKVVLSFAFIISIIASTFYWFDEIKPQEILRQITIEMNRFLPQKVATVEDAQTKSSTPPKSEFLINLKEYQNAIGMKNDIDLVDCSLDEEKCFTNLKIMHPQIETKIKNMLDTTKEKLKTSDKKTKIAWQVFKNTYLVHIAGAYALHPQQSTPTKLSKKNLRKLYKSIANEKSSAIQIIDTLSKDIESVSINERCQIIKNSIESHYPHINTSLLCKSIEVGK